jgi:hypothetical protein
MTPNLLEATIDYWRKLNQLEAAYQRDEVSLDEVNVKVKELMAELGESRRSTFRYLWYHLQQGWNEQRSMLSGIAAIVLLTYFWLNLSGLS